MCLHGETEWEKNSSQSYERRNRRWNFVQAIHFTSFPLCFPVDEAGLQVLHLYFSAKSPEGRNVMPLSSVPSKADTSHCLNWVIHLPICFIVHEGDSPELGDRESYIHGKERRLLLPSQHFSKHGGGRRGTGEGVLGMYSLSLFQTLQPAGPKACSFLIHELSSCLFLFFFFFF